MTLSHAGSAEQFADTLTKALSSEKFRTALLQLNIRSRHAARAAAAETKDFFICYDCKQKVLYQEEKTHICMEVPKIRMKVAVARPADTVSEMVLKAMVSLAHDAAVRVLDSKMDPTPQYHPCEESEEVDYGVKPLVAAAAAGAVVTGCCMRRCNSKKVVRDVGIQSQCSYVENKFKFLGHRVDHFVAGAYYEQAEASWFQCCRRRQRRVVFGQGVERHLD